MRTEQKRDVKKYFFLLPNAVFELGLHVYELAIYAYLLRIEDRRTWQCVVSYPAVADKLGISVNTVAKYVGLLEEHGLITTERTDVFTKDGLKRNGCLRYTILPTTGRTGAGGRSAAGTETSGKVRRGVYPSEQGAKRMTPPVSPCGPLCGPMTGGAESLPLLAGSGRCGPVVGGVAAQGFRRTEGRKEKQDKNRGHRWLFRPVCRNSQTTLG